jgi:hypothetical protein
MLLQESIEFFGEIRNEGSNVDGYVFVDNSVDVDNVDVDFRVEG